MNTCKIAVVGNPASGMTVFIAALADCLHADKSRKHSFALVPENLNTMRFIAYTQHQMRVKREWPMVTNFRWTILRWTLMHDGKAVAHVEIPEFANEIFTAAFLDYENPCQPELIENLKGYLCDAQCVVVLISLSEIYRELHHLQDEGELSRVVNNKWAVRSCIDYIYGKRADVKIIVALTQADIMDHRKMLDELGGAKGVFERVYSHVSAVYPKMNVIPLSSVTGVDKDGRLGEAFSTSGSLVVLEALGLFDRAFLNGN